MPILQAEPTYFPDDLFDRTRSSPLFDMPVDAEDANLAWWTLYTRPRCEKALLRKLRLWEFDHYCPMISQRTGVRSTPSRVAHLPLFANYVFLRGGEIERYQAVCSGHVVRCLPVPNPQAFFGQLRTIHRMIAAGMPMEMESQLDIGTEVRVKSGPLRGLCGQIIKRHHQSRFVVYLNFLECGASTLLDSWDIETL
jgi:transcriptional antiterminator RfaH